MPQGPGPLLDGQPLGLEPQGNPDVGAVNALAPDPTNANVLYAGTTDGGIWRTTNATASSPAWTPIADNQPALAIGAIAISPLDSNTLYAGTGSFTNGSFGGYGQNNGGTALGVLKSSDGGNSWALLAPATFVDQRIRSIVPTPLVTATGQVVLAGTAGDNGATGGVYQSDDGGTSWQRISGQTGSGLPDGDCRSIVEDPANPSILYTAVIGMGVYQSTNDGQTWASVNSTIPSTLLSATNNLLLAARASRGFTTLFLLTAAPSDPSVHRSPGVSHLFWTTNPANSWTEMDAVPLINGDDQEGNNLAVSADPSSPSVVWVSGSAADVGGGGRSIVYRGDFSQPSGSQWAVAVWRGSAGGSGNQPTITHSDARSLTFDAAGNLLLTSDGGIYKLVNPEATQVNSNGLNTQRYWVSVNGDIQTTEFYSVAYDAVDHVIAGGAQDNGMGIQPQPGQAAWQTALGDDVTHVAVNDAVSPAEFYGIGGSFAELTRIPFGTFSRTQVLLASPQTPTQADSGLVGADTTVTEGAYIPFVLDAVDPQRLLIGFNNLYEDAQTGPPHLTGDLIADVSPSSSSGLFSALAYGGTSGGVADPDVAFAGTSTGDVFARTSSAASGGTFKLVQQFSGSVVRSISLDPADWHTAYFVTTDSTSGSHVWQMTVTNAGAPSGLVEVTGNLVQLAGGLQTVLVVHPTRGATTLVVGGLGQGTGPKTGGVFRTICAINGPATQWSVLGSAMPDVPVHDLLYNATDDVLVAATFGRGAWTLANAAQALLPLPPPPPPPAPSGGGAGGSVAVSATFPASVMNQLFLDLLFLPSFSTPDAQAMLAQQFALSFALASLQAPQEAPLLVAQEASLILELALDNSSQALVIANALASNPLYNVPVGYTLALLEGEVLLSSSSGL
jgi:hypothetical protein